MLIVYLSLTGNVRSFVKRTELESVEINYSDPLFEVHESFIMIAPSYDDDITDIISSFLNYKNNLDYLVGFVGSGNLNFDHNYCFNARDLAQKYQKPLLFTFEFSGTDEDVIYFKKEVNQLASTGIK